MPKRRENERTRPPYERILQFHELIKAGKYPNCSTLARKFEMHLRTINRDLEFMRDRLELPIEYDSSRKGFYYSKPVDRFPHMPITEAEIFALLVAHQAIAQYQGTPFEQPLQTAFRKLTGQLDQDARYTLGNPDELLSFRPLAPEMANVETFQILTRALKEKRGLRFTYRNLGARKSQQRLVHPYHLACIDNHWYLFAFDVDRNAMRTFVLTRLTRPELTEMRFKIPRKFDLNEYLRGSFTVFKGEADYEVVIEFDAWATDLVRNRKWHASQESTELAEGCSRMRFRLNNIEEMVGWVLSWGAHATVVRPRELLERVQSTAKNIFENCAKAQTDGAEPGAKSGTPSGKQARLNGM